jgi:DNA recombination-dependent growth factor C
MTQKQATKAFKTGEIDMNDMKLGKDKPSVKKQSKFQQDVTAHVDEAKVITKNAMEFIETLALLIVTGFAIYGSLHYELRTEYKYAVLFSGVVVGLIAMNLLRKFLARR